MDKSSQKKFFFFSSKKYIGFPSFLSERRRNFGHRKGKVIGKFHYFECVQLSLKCSINMGKIIFTHMCTVNSNSSWFTYLSPAMSKKAPDSSIQSLLMDDFTRKMALLLVLCRTSVAHCLSWPSHYVVQYHTLIDQYTVTNLLIMFF